MRLSNDIRDRRPLASVISVPPWFIPCRLYCELVNDTDFLGETLRKSKSLNFHTTEM